MVLLVGVRLGTRGNISSCLGSEWCLYVLVPGGFLYLVLLDDLIVCGISFRRRLVTSFVVYFGCAILFFSFSVYQTRLRFHIAFYPSVVFFVLFFVCIRYIRGWLVFL